MKEIKLTQGKVALVDDNCFDFLSQWNWYAYKSNNTFYAGRNITFEFKRQRRINMHRLLMGVVKDIHVVVDHIDHNGLNCQKYNLRICDTKLNCRNQLKTTTKLCSSKYKGVCYLPERNKYRAKIMIDRKYAELGTYKTELEAALAYNKGAIKYHGEFACLNVI